jgi:uncharacterized integral membrane protein (TIGR00697 family)
MTRKDIVFVILGGFFLTNALLAEMIGGKLIYVGSESWRIGPLGPFIMSVGIIPWPIVFLTTDLINEYFGKRGVRRLTFLAAGMILYAFVVLGITMQVPAVPGMGVSDESYNHVFGQSQWIIVGSLTAFLVSQLIDVFVFHMLRKRTGKSLLWLRATGSTVVSQLIDSVIVLYIGLAIPGQWSFQQFMGVALTNYSVKLLVALALTPLIYAGHWLIERFLGKSVAESLAEEAARDRSPD